MKALVLCGGEGTRMRPLSYSQPKHLIPIANRPVIERILLAIREAGLSEIGIVVSPSTQEAFQASLLDGSRYGLRLSYIVQHEPKGIAHAVACAESFVGDDSFVLYLGDNLMQNAVEEIVKRFTTSGCHAVISLVQVEDPRRFGVARLEGETIVELVEKPVDPPSDLAIAGVYVFCPLIFSAIRKITPSQRGELEITDAIQRLIDDGYNVIHHRITGWWKDVGNPEDMIAANRLLLEDLGAKIAGEIDDSSRIEGGVQIGQGTLVRRSRVIGPVIISEDAVLEDAIIGPYVSIGRNVLIRNSQVTNSIILKEAAITGVGRIEKSLIGRGTQISLGKSRSGRSFVLGDHCQVWLEA